MSQELAKKAVKSLRFLGRDLVVFRGEDGSATILDAYCPHLGAHLGVGGKVIGNTIQCPFHGWRYDSKGECVSIPYCKKIPPRAHLQAWNVCEVNGHIFAYFDAKGGDPSFDIPQLFENGAHWTNFVTRSWTINTTIEEASKSAMNIQLLEGASIDRTMHGVGIVHGASESGRIKSRIVMSMTPIDAKTVDLQIAVSARKGWNPLINASVKRMIPIDVSNAFAQGTRRHLNVVA